MLHFPRFPFATRGKFDRSRRTGNVRWSIEAVCPYAPKLRPTLNHTARRMYTHSPPPSFSFLRKPKAQLSRQLSKPYFRVALFSPIYIFILTRVLWRVTENIWWKKKKNNNRNKIEISSLFEIGLLIESPLANDDSRNPVPSWISSGGVPLSTPSLISSGTPFPDIARLHVFRCNRKT